MLNGAAWILKIITVPLEFILRRIWPVAETEHPELDLKQPEIAVINPASPAPVEKPIVPPGPIAEGYPTAKEDFIKPAVKIKPGWFALPVENLPHSTYWPVVLSLGLLFGVFGLVTSFIFSLVGIVLFILGIAGWIGNMWNEQSE